jgi:hypothetical protein
VAAFALVTLTRRNLTDSAETDAIASANAIAELIGNGAVDDPLPSAGDVFGQVVDPSGSVSRPLGT